MAILDYVILGCAVFALVMGLVKGILKPLFGLGGTLVVIYAGGALSPYIQPVLSNVIKNEGTSSIVAMVISMLVILFVYTLITDGIVKLINKTKILGKLNRLLGGALGVIIVYLVVAVITAFMTNEAEMFAGLRENFGEAFQQSWIVQNVFANNPVGDFVVNSAFEKLIEMLETALPQPQ